MKGLSRAFLAALLLAACSDAAQPTTIPTTGLPTTPVSSVGPGIIEASEGGVVIRPFDGQPVVLESDRYYEATATAVPDGAGGIFFTHVVTPLPWPQGSIMRLSPGAGKPEIAVAPEDPTSEWLRPIRSFSGSDGTPMLLYQRETAGDAGSFAGTEIYALELQTRAAHLLVGPLPGVSSPSTDGERLLIVRDDGQCWWFELHSLDGQRLDDDRNPRPEGTCQGGPISAAALTSDFLFALESRFEPQLVAYDLGAKGGRWVTAATNSWHLSAAGSRVLVQGEDSFLATVEDDWVIEPVELGITGLASLFDDQLQVAPEASLGSGTGELPCPEDPEVVAPGNDLPAPVATTFSRLAGLAAACDYAGLNDFADSRVSFSFGGGDDLGAHLILVSRQTGQNQLDLLLDILATDPALATGGDGVVYYAWPAVFVTGADEDWAAVEAIYDPSVIEQFRQFGGYIGLRVGIAQDGTWLFAIAGD